MKTRLCLVRHGETAWNAEARLQGWTDVPLNAEGEAQARAAAAELAGTRFDALFSSPLARARRTAELIAAAQAPGAAALQLDPRLRERHHGELQGLTRNEIALHSPAVHALLNARCPGYLPPGGESVEVFAARVHAALKDLARLGGTVLAVAHGGVLDMAYRLATDADLHSARQHALPNAAINWLVFSGGGWRVEAWGLTGHLEREGRDETGG
ncbi:putative phosphoglycerate mutase [Inhella inkyongensis]|uniref:Putative phosphoglycerate mutase n=1 Tax=Inhella inkyongensis TaxID=392593 RepID=A0A840S199_9BURK|nr:histidine phosphatase family protein [Inhella inkyongensis]MBB5204055.1 putative phosphoglycerate mutase [Inhella inkyongensis]